MSDIQYQLYRQSVMRLAGSLLIKDENMATAINTYVRNVYQQYGMEFQDDPTTWKYYMNMAGEYHPLDVPMQIVSLDTMETINFDRPSLLVNRATLRAYTYDSRYYSELVAKYPNQEFLIRGILNPVNKVAAIAATNYTILRHDTSEVESNETDLIEKLQRWVFAFVSRWNNGDFALTDDLYSAAFMGALYANIPAAIMILRKENVGTYRAHSFHIWNHLESHGKLSRFRDFLTTKQKLWLYRNIKWVFANAGNEYTFEKLMDIVLTHRGLPLGYYEQIINNEDINENIYGAPLMQRTPLNLFEQTAPEPTFRSVLYVMEKEIPLARDNIRFHQDNYNEWMYKLSRSKLTRTLTKTYESEVIDTSEQLPITLPEMLLNHWLYFSTHNRYPAVVSIVNPYTSQTIRTTVKEAFVLWLYAVNKINNIELDTIPALDAIYVRRSPIPTVEQLMGVVDNKLVSKTLVERLVLEQVPVGVMVSTEAFYDTVNEIHTTYLNHRKAFEYQQHLEARGYVNAIVDRFYQLVRCQLTDNEGETFAQYFDNRGWDLSDFSRSDYELLINDIFEKATGSDVRINVSLRDVQSAMLKIMSQLGTYATHYIPTIDAVPATVIGNVGIRVGNNDMEEFENIKVDRSGVWALRTKVTDKSIVRADVGKRFLDYAVGFPKSSEHYELNPTVGIKSTVAQQSAVRVLLPSLQIETDLTADLADMNWANIPDLNVGNEVYLKTISPSVVLPITLGELNSMTISECRLHSRNPGSVGTDNELRSIRYRRMEVSFDLSEGNRRPLMEDVSFSLTAGDVVGWVSYWHDGDFLFSVPTPMLFFPIDGVITIDSETTYVESSNG